MTVRFTDSAGAKPASTRPELGSLLAPILAGRVRQTQDPARVLLACFVRGLAARYSAAAVTAHLTARADGSLRDALSSDSGLALALARRARRHLAEVHSADGRVAMRRRIAPRLVARIFSPTPEGSGISPAMDARSRAVLIVIAARAMEVTADARASVLIAPGWLGSVVNLTERQAWTVLRTLEKRGWLSRTARAAGRSLWKLTELENDDLRSVAWANADAVDALTAGRPGEHLLAAVVMSSPHPAWWFSEGALGPRRCSAAGEHAAPGASIGMGIAPLRRARAELDRWGPRAVEASGLASYLGEVSEQTLARYVAGDRRAAAVEESKRQRAKLEVFHAERQAKYEQVKDARKALRSAFELAGFPPAAGDRTAIEQWVPRLIAPPTPMLGSGGSAEVLVGALDSALQRARYSEDVKAKVGQFVMAQARARGTH